MSAAQRRYPEPDARAKHLSAESLCSSFPCCAQLTEEIRHWQGKPVCVAAQASHTHCVHATKPAKARSVPNAHHARHCAGGVTQEVHHTGGDAFSQRAGQAIWMHKEHLANEGRPSALAVLCTLTMWCLHPLRCLHLSSLHPNGQALTRMRQTLRFCCGLSAEP